MIINLLEAPLLAFILGYISKFSADGTYTFAANKNYPVFMFMGLLWLCSLDLLLVQRRSSGTERYWRGEVPESEQA